MLCVEQAVIPFSFTLMLVCGMCLLLCEGFACFKCFFENVNQNENKLKKMPNIMVNFMHYVLLGMVSGVTSSCTNSRSQNTGDRCLCQYPQEKPVNQFDEW